MGRVKRSNALSWIFMRYVLVMLGSLVGLVIVAWLLLYLLISVGCIYPEDYKAYEEYFVDQLPYTDEELVEMSKLSLDDLKATAAKVSIEDAAERAGK